MKKNYYSTLGIAQNATEDEIKQAYRKLAKKYHPDLHPDDGEAKRKFQEVGEAWETLKDEKKREKYDEALSGVKSGGKGKNRGKGQVDPQSGSVSYEDIMSGFSSFFSEENIKKKAGKAEKNPLDTTNMFEGFMKFKK